MVKNVLAGGWGKRRGTHNPAADELQGKLSRALANAPWVDSTWRNDLVARLTRHLLTLDPPLVDAIKTAVGTIVMTETRALQMPATKPASIVEAVTQRKQQNALLTFTHHADQLLHEWVDALSHILRKITDAVPEIPSNAIAINLTVPFIYLTPHPIDLVTDIVTSLLRFAHDDPFVVVPGAVLARRVKENLLKISRITEDAGRKNPHRIISPRQSGLTGEALAAVFLGGTPFFALLTLPVPFVIPRRFYPEHTLIVAASGSGKTQYLQSLVLQFLNESDPPGMFILDSQDDEKGILHKLAHLQLFDDRLKDRIVILSPEDKPALNLFSFTDDSAETDELFTYLMSAIDRDLTAKMSTATAYILRLLRVIKKPTIHTFKSILEDPTQYATEIAQLDQISKDFFAKQFSVKSEMGATRLQVASRLYSVLANRAFTEMFAAESNCLDVFDAIQKKKIVLVNTSERKLGAAGLKIFGRYMVAQVMAAAMKRGESGENRDLTLLMLDEAHEYFDSQTEKILRQARKFNVGLVAATQMYDQIEPRVKAALATNTSTKIIGRVSHDDARHLANEVRCEPEFIRALENSTGTFVTYVRGLTPRALALKVPFGVLEAAPKMSAESHRAMRERNRLALTTVSQVPQETVAPTAPDTPSVPVNDAVHSAPHRPQPISKPPRDRDPTPPRHEIKPGKKWK